MLNKKITILILTIAVATAVSGCIKKTEKPAVNDNDQKIIQEQKKEFVCGIIKEENGLKTYRNEYWGVEFSFKDEEDNFKISQGCKGNIVISENSERLNPYIYIYFYKNSFKFDQKQQANLKEYIEAGGWDVHQESAELISIKEIKNNNGLTFIETIANVSGGRQFSGYYKVSSYYMEYNKIKDKNYIYIRGPALNSPDLYKKWKVIIDTFKFIDYNKSTVTCYDPEYYDYSNWKIYKDKKRNYEIKYPDSWKISESDENYPVKTIFLVSTKRIEENKYGPYACYSDIRINIYQSLEHLPRNREQKYSLKEWLKKDDRNFNNETSVLDGNIYYISESGDCDSDHKSKSFFIEKNGLIYEVRQNFNIGFSLEEFNKIIASFHFID